MTHVAFAIAFRTLKKSLTNLSFLLPSLMFPVIFFVGFQSREYHLLGYFDLMFFIPEAVLLTLAFRQLDVHDRAAAANGPFEQI